MIEEFLFGPDSTIRTKLHDYSAKDCLESLMSSNPCMALPCRENELLTVSEFLEQALVKEKPCVLSLYGASGLGKTSILYVATQMLSKPNQIFYIDCQNEMCLQSWEDIQKRRVVVLDNFAGQVFMAQISQHYYPLNASLVVVSRNCYSMESFQNNFTISIASLGSYSVAEMKTILEEKLGDTRKIIQPEAIEIICRKACQNRGWVPQAMQLLVQLIQTAIKYNLPVINASLLEEEAPEPNSQSTMLI